MDIIVDNEELNIKSKTATGAHIRSYLPNRLRDWHLWQQHEGKDDTLVKDDTVLMPPEDGSKIRLFTAPKAING